MIVNDTLLYEQLLSSQKLLQVAEGSSCRESVKFQKQKVPQIGDLHWVPSPGIHGTPWKARRGLQEPEESRTQGEHGPQNKPNLAYRDTWRLELQTLCLHSPCQAFCNMSWLCSLQYLMDLLAVGTGMFMSLPPALGNFPLLLGCFTQH